MEAVGMKRMVRFAGPVRINHERDQYGCTGFDSFGYKEMDNGEIVHIKNPDYKWTKSLRRAGDTWEEDEIIHEHEQGE